MNDLTSGASLENNDTMTEGRATILAVDDSKVILIAAVKALKEEFNVLKASDGDEAWELVQKHPEISLVFSDLAMPNMSGYELLEKIRSSENPEIAKLPVVILTGQEDGDGTKEKVMAAGATDFLIKPFDSLDLISRARSLSTLTRQVHELEKKVSLDKLTRLYTENSFNESGDRAIAYAIRHNTPITVVYFSIDGFSEIFIKHGKQVAEDILTKLAGVIKPLLRQEDVAARLAIAKFALLLIETDCRGSRQVIERLKSKIDEIDFGIDEKIKLSVGSCSPITSDLLKFDQTRAKAERVLARAVEEGGDRVVYNEECKKGDESSESAEAAHKRGPRIDLSAVLREVEGNEGKRLGEKQLNAALNSVIPLLKFLNKKLSLEIDDAIAKMESKVSK